MKVKLSTLWIFVTLNYLYCDVMSLMNPEALRQYLTGRIEGFDISQGFLLGAAILMEIPIAMVLVSRLLPQCQANRWANLVAATIMTIVQAASLFVGVAPVALYYAFFSALEIAATIAVWWLALRWRPTADQPAPAVTSPVS